MTTPRNSPCPCGSGRKYKHCCQPRDAMRRADEARELQRIAAAEHPWEVEAIPLICRFDDPDPERPGALVITAGPFVLRGNIVPTLPCEPEQIAAILEGVIADTAQLFGVFPERVHMRHASLVDALAPRLAPRDLTVHTVAQLDNLERAARSLMKEVAGQESWPPIGRTEKWSGWQLPPDTVEQLFSASADFWRAAPWRHLANIQAPSLVLPSGTRWTASVLGGAGGDFGLCLYSVADDLFVREMPEGPDDEMPSVEGRILYVLFADTSDSSPRATREAWSRGWEIAEPAAFPELMTVNSPGGGVTGEDAADVIAALRSIPRFAAAHARTLDRELRLGQPVRSPIEWADPETGVQFQYAGEGIASASDEEDDDSLDLMNERLADSLGGYNNRPQRDLGGLSPTQVDQLMRADWTSPNGPVQLNAALSAESLEGSPLLFNARLLLGLAAERGSLSATKAGNLQLAVVRELIGRIRIRPGDLTHLQLQRRVLEEDVASIHYLRVVLGIANLLVLRKGGFALTKQGREALEPGSRGRLYARLFDTYFRHFNLGYQSHWSWPELQHQTAFTLLQLQTQAAEWRTAEDLLERVVLPYALERSPRNDHFDPASLLLATHVLRPLVELGLLEMDPADPRGLSNTLYRITPLNREFIRFMI